MKLNVEFPDGWGGGGIKPKNHPWGRYGYFLEQDIADHIDSLDKTYNQLNVGI